MVSYSMDHTRCGPLVAKFTYLEILYYYDISNYKDSQTLYICIY